MRLNQHPAIRDGEIADASRRQHTSQLGKMRQLLRLFTDMFDHMVGKNDVKTVDREGQLRAVDHVKAIALRDPPTVHHVDRIKGAVNHGMSCRSEERRVAKACVSTYRARWKAYH